MSFLMSRVKIASLVALQLSVLAAAGTNRYCYGQTQGTGDEQIRFHIVQVSGNPPLRILAITVGDKPVQLESKSTVSGRWVRAIKVTVQNISLKTVIEAAVILSYPETGTGESNSPILTTTSHLGRYPSSAFRQRDGTSRALPDQVVQPAPITMKPGETMTFTLSENADLDQDSAHRLAKHLSQVSVGLGPVYFADGSAWKSNTYLTPGEPPNIWNAGDPTDFIKP